LNQGIEEPWTVMTKRRSSLTEENVSNLAKFLQRKSLGSVSTLSSNRSSLKAESDYERTVKFSPDPEIVKIGTDVRTFII
jgi:hypothetical protein